MRFLAMVLIVSTTVCALRSTGQAAEGTPDPDSERHARRAYERGEAYFKEGSFAQALKEYEAGYDAVPLPGFLINIAQCQRRLGDLRQARLSYRKFIMVAPDSEFAPEVTKLIAELDELIAESDRGGEAVEPPPAPIAVLAPAAPVGPSLVEHPAAPAVTKAQHRWWLWGSVAASAVVAVTVGILLLRDPGTSTIHDGTLGTLRR